MKGYLKEVLFLLLLSNYATAQEIGIEKTTSTEKLIVTSTNSSAWSKTKPVAAFAINPTIGLGVGIFSFFGDVYDKNVQSTTVSRIAYDLSVSQALSEHFQLTFNVLFGKLGANERLAPNNRNLNFESHIRAGGLNVSYNWGHLLPKSRRVSPYIAIGIESIEFLSKIDALDENGNEYFYWTDGSIRDIDQDATNANTAVELKRDYVYESDIREMNLDNFGKYAERSFAVPIGIGATFKINDFINFKMGTAMHFTFTDYIDGVTFMSKGNRQGDNKNDRFLMTSCAISYNFGSSKRQEVNVEENGQYEGVDFLAIDAYDFDEDGVSDLLDSCQGTPVDAIVDAKGCPIDDDEDNYPNYRDDEIESSIDAFVDVRGVELSDSLIEDKYRRYIDPTYGQLQTYRTHKGVVQTIDPSIKVYSVDLGTFSQGLPTNVMTKFLSVKDISSNNIDKSTTNYSAGKFNDLAVAKQRKQQLIEAGLTDLKIVYKQNGRTYDANKVEKTLASVTTQKTIKTESEKDVPTVVETGNAIKDIDNVTPAPVVPTQDTDTPTEKVEVTEKPKTGTIATTPVVKTKISSIDAEELQKRFTNMYTTIDKPSTNNTTKTKLATNQPIQDTKGKTNSPPVISDKSIVLRVQLGAFRKQISKSVFKGVSDVIEIKTNNGLYKYLTGSFNSFDKAAKHKLNMVLKGYAGAFITAYRDGQRITLKEAGATPVIKGDLLDTPDSKQSNNFRNELVKFKVQVGVFKNQPPNDKLEIFAKLKEITGEKTKSGLTRYVVGSYSTYKEANTVKNNIVKTYGLVDPFVVALFNNEYISIQEATELLK